MKSVVKTDIDAIDNVSYSITEFDIQNEAMTVLSRYLTDEEIYTAQKA